MKKIFFGIPTHATRPCVRAIIAFVQVETRLFVPSVVSQIRSDQSTIRGSWCRVSAGWIFIWFIVIVSLNISTCVGKYVNKMNKTSIVSRLEANDILPDVIQNFVCKYSLILLTSVWLTSVVKGAPIQKKITKPWPSVK